jgi:NADH-quinone oxidoreductase subunit G
VLPNLLPGGRPFADAGARVDLAAAWGVNTLPETIGRDGDGILAAAAAGELGALVVGGVDPADLPDPDLAARALEAAFVVSLELRASAVTAAADVVFPVAPVVDKAGSFVNWEGRVRTFERALDHPGSLPDVRVLAGIAEELGTPLGFRTPEQARAEMVEAGPWDGARPTRPGSGMGGGPEQARDPQSGEASPEPNRSQARGHGSGLVLSSWKLMLDDGRMQDGEPHLRATARRPVVLVTPAVLDGLGVAPGDPVTLSGPRGSVTLPVGVGDELVDGVVWAPASAPGLPVRHLVGPAGSAVSVTAAKGVEKP